MPPIIIYIRGGDKTAPGIAKAAGMEYGTRHDYKPYAPVYMLDVNWKKFNWTDYLDKVRRYQPAIAMLPDYEYPGQRRQLYQYLREIKPMVAQVAICPKFPGAIAHVPSWCIVAVSVPTNYAGYLPPLMELKGRRVHLLGGRPEIQAELMVKINGAGGDVVSIDGSYHAVKAAYGQYFDGHKWIEVTGVSTLELCAISARNIAQFLLSAACHAQPPLHLE